MFGNNQKKQAKKLESIIKQLDDLIIERVNGGDRFSENNTADIDLMNGAYGDLYEALERFGTHWPHKSIRK